VIRCLWYAGADQAGKRHEVSQILYLVGVWTFCRLFRLATRRPLRERSAMANRATTVTAAATLTAFAQNVGSRKRRASNNLQSAL